VLPPPAPEISKSPTPVASARSSTHSEPRTDPLTRSEAKEIAPESSFHFYVLSAEPISLPRWIRLGKWHSKALLECEEVAWERKTGPYRAAAALNPLDLSGDVLRAFDIISMPPSSLVANAQCYGEYYAFKENPTVGLPVGLHYNFKA